MQTICMVYSPTWTHSSIRTYLSLLKGFQLLLSNSCYWNEVTLNLSICLSLALPLVPPGKPIYPSVYVCLVTLCDSMDSSPPGSSVHGILQARILEWVAMPSSRGSSQPRDWTQVSHIAGGFFTIWVTREVHLSIYLSTYLSINHLSNYK